MNRRGTYNPEIELQKGATLTAGSYDKTQSVAVAENKVTVGGKAGVAEISGLATGRPGSGIEGTMGLWLSIFRYMRPDGTIDHVAGWNIMVPLAAGQTATETAAAFAAQINAGTRPYKAAAYGNDHSAELRVVFVSKQR